MAYNDFDIEQLMFKKATGSISKEEEQLLEATIAGNPEAHAHYQDILQTLGTPQNKAFLDNYDQQAGWQQIADRVSPTQTPRITIPDKGQGSQRTWLRRLERSGHTHRPVRNLFNILAELPCQDIFILYEHRHTRRRY